MKLNPLSWFAKASASGPANASMRVGHPQYSDALQTDRSKFAPEVMKSNVAFAALRKIAQSFAAVPYYTAREDGTETPAPELSHLLRRPNIEQSGTQFRELWALYYAIHGEAWTERVVVGAGKVQELWLHDPARMAPIPDASGVIGAFEERTKGGSTVRWDVNVVTGESDMLFTRAPNPTDSYRGFAATVPAAASVDANNDGREWNAALLRHSAAPSGIMTFEEELIEEQRERLKQRLDTQYGGPSNAGRPMVVEGKMTWQQLGLSPRDMEWIEGNRETARAVALAFGVPPMLLGIPGDNTYSNYREARLAFYDETVIPLAKLYADEMSRFLSEKFNGALIAVNEDEIEALDFRRETRWDRIEKAEFLTLDEKREAMGYEPLGPERGGDLVIAVQRFGAMGFVFDEADPEAAGRQAFGAGDDT
jgi:HK97 family phage portal protein